MRVAPAQLLVLQYRFLRISGQIVRRDGHDVAVQQPCIQQFADDIAHAACRVEMVHIARTVGIDPRDQRHGGRQFVEILPVDHDACRARDRGNMDRMVGRSAGRQQADAGVDDRLFIDAEAKRTVIVAFPANFGKPVHRRARQFGAQLRARIDEGRTGNVQPHHLHHHLVGIGRAVKGAGACPMIGWRFRLQQFVAADFAFGIKLADALLFLVGKAATASGLPGINIVGKWPKRSAPISRPGTILSQMPSSAMPSNIPWLRPTAVDIAMTSRLNSDSSIRILPLRHPVAHRRNAACDLRRGADFAGDRSSSVRDSGHRADARTACHYRR